MDHDDRTELFSARTDARTLIERAVRTGEKVLADHSDCLAAELQRAVDRERGNVYRARDGEVEYCGPQDNRRGYPRLPKWRVRLRSPSAA